LGGHSYLHVVWRFPTLYDGPVFSSLVFSVAP